jgi:hypothetical protein
MAEWIIKDNIAALLSFVIEQFENNNFLIREGNTGTNKRYSKCGYACSLKNLESLHTFVLADS